MAIKDHSPSGLLNGPSLLLKGESMGICQLAIAQRVQTWAKTNEMRFKVIKNYGASGHTRRFGYFRPWRAE